MTVRVFGRMSPLQQKKPQRGSLPKENFFKLDPVIKEESISDSKAVGEKLQISMKQSRMGVQDNGHSDSQNAMCHALQEEIVPEENNTLLIPRGRKNVLNSYLRRTDSNNDEVKTRAQSAYVNNNGSEEHDGADMRNAEHRTVGRAVESTYSLTHGTIKHINNKPQETDQQSDIMLDSQLDHIVLPLLKKTARKSRKAEKDMFGDVTRLGAEYSGDG